MPNRWGTKYDNEVFVDFDILLDLDMAIYKYIRRKYKNSNNVYNKNISLKSEYDAIYIMINRQEMNPLSLIMKDINIDEFNNSLLSSHKEELLSLIKPTDILYLMNTYIDNASSIEITAHCNDEIELKYFNSISKLMQLKYKIICSEKEETSLKGYTSIYVKNFLDLEKFKDLDAKNIYIANTLYNTMAMLKHSDLLKKIAKSNEIRTIDMYKKVKAEPIPNNILEEIDKK